MDTSWDLEQKDTIDDELGNYFKDANATGAPGVGVDPVLDSEDQTQSAKLSQLRMLLEKNLKSPTSAFKPAKPEPVGSWGEPTHYGDDGTPGVVQQTVAAVSSTVVGGAVNTVVTMAARETEAIPTSGTVFTQLLLQMA